MKEPPHRLLDRNKYPAKPGLLVDVVDYGSNLITISFNSSKKDISAIVIIGILLKQVVSMLDAAEILIRSDAVPAAFVQARTALEASIYIDWILKEDSEDRAKSHYVSALRKRRKEEHKIITGSEEEREVAAMSEEISIEIERRRPTAEKKAKTAIQEIDISLSSEELSTINKKFEAYIEKGKKKGEPKWYQIFGTNSIRDVAVEVQRIAEYGIFYNALSKTIHSHDYLHIIRTPDRVELKPIRNAENLDFLLPTLISVASRTYKVILKKYNTQQELQQFNKEFSAIFKKLSTQLDL